VALSDAVHEVLKVLRQGLVAEFVIHSAKLLPEVITICWAKSGSLCFSR